MCVGSLACGDPIASRFYRRIGTVVATQIALPTRYMYGLLEHCRHTGGFCVLLR